MQRPESNAKRSRVTCTRVYISESYFGCGKRDSNTGLHLNKMTLVYESSPPTKKGATGKNRFDSIMVIQPSNTKIRIKISLSVALRVGLTAGELTHENEKNSKDLFHAVASYDAFGKYDLIHRVPNFINLVTAPNAHPLAFIGWMRQYVSDRHAHSTGPKA